MPTLTEKEKILNKVKRFSLVITLRKIMPFVAVVGVFFLTIVLGIWNVRRIDYSEDEIKYTDISKLEETLRNLSGKNIFLVDIDKVEKEIREKNTFVKTVEVEKVIPNRLRLSIEEYIPMYGFVFNNKCNLYSKEGVKIYEVCENCSSECKTAVAQWKPTYIESSNSLDNDGVFMYSKEIGNIIIILSEFGYTVTEVKMTDGVTTLYTTEQQFIFDLNEDLDTQLARMYLVGKKISSDGLKFKTLDLRFERPVLKNS